VLFDQNTLASNWREQVLHCWDKGISVDREIVFALAVADLLQLPDDIPLMPAVKAAMFIPVRLSDRASLAHLKAVAHTAGRRALARADKELRTGHRVDKATDRTSSSGLTLMSVNG
jgi:hypothetical protein